MNQLQTDLTILNLSIFDYQLRNTSLYVTAHFDHNARVDTIHLSRLAYANIDNTASHENVPHCKKHNNGD